MNCWSGIDNKENHKIDMLFMMNSWNSLSLVVGMVHRLMWLCLSSKVKGMMMCMCC